MLPIISHHGDLSIGLTLQEAESLVNLEKSTLKTGLLQEREIPTHVQLILEGSAKVQGREVVIKHYPWNAAWEKIKTVRVQIGKLGIKELEGNGSFLTGTTSHNVHIFWTARGNETRA